MSHNQETMVWLLHEERMQELDQIERERSLPANRRGDDLEEFSDGSRRSGGIRRAVGIRLMRLGAELANLSSTELAGSAR